ncbi:hypothetical protein niasHT_032158 [Heterodera trifolii]|uniref:Uncharacterized protein n=1 Tax=Heterodera trifolii TaxID=157864 RepID=A0ABD2HR43_9BILA
MRKLLILNIFVAWIFGVFANFKCYDVLEDEEFDVPDNNLMVELYTNGDLLEAKENGGDNDELKQFICDLSRWYILFGMELDHHTNNQTQSKGKAVGTTTAHAKKSNKSCCFKFSTKTKTKAEKDDEKKQLKEKIGILKSIDQADQTLGNMLRKMYTLINKIKQSFDEKQSHITEMQELQQLDMEIVRAVIYLAYRLGIQIEKIIPNENELKIEQIELLNGLANVWLKYRRKNWHYQQKPENEREKCKRKNKQYEKRLLQFVANFSNKGLDELSKLKRDRKNGRRRKRNPSNNTKSKLATVIVIVVMLMALSLCVINHCDNSGGSENSDQNHHRQQLHDSDATQTSNEKTDGSGISINEPLLRGKGQKKGGNRRISARKLNKMRQTKAKQFVEQRERASETENEEEDIVFHFNSDGGLEPASVSYGTPRTSFPSAWETAESGTSILHQLSLEKTDRDFGDNEKYLFDFENVSDRENHHYQHHDSETEID